MPVSNISVLDSSSLNFGGSRWIGQRSVISSELGSDVQRDAEHVEHLALGNVAHGDGDGRARVGHLGAAHQAVGRLQRNRADNVVADVLGDLRLSVLDSSPNEIGTVRQLNSSGSEPRPNSTSTTGPMTRTTRPMPPAVSRRCLPALLR
jgi:hypothetical protein